MSKRKVLIPLDGSEFSRQVLPYIPRVFTPETHDLIVMRVVQQWEGVLGDPLWMSTAGMALPVYIPEWSVTPNDPGWQELRAALISEMESELQPLHEAGYQLAMAVHVGDPVEEIVALARREEVDVVALATHDRTGVSRFVFGSVADEVTRRLTSSVLLVHPAEGPPPPQSAGAELASLLAQGDTLRLALATDGSPGTYPAIKLTGELARTIQSRLTLIVAVHEREGVERCRLALDKVREVAGTVAPDPDCVPLIGWAEEVLLRYLRERPFDLVVLGPFRHHTGTNPQALGPTAHRLLQLVPTSVLVAKGTHPSCHRVLVCADVEDDGLVQLGSQLAQALGAKLQLLHVLEKEGPEIETLSLEALLQHESLLSAFLQNALETLSQAGATSSDLLVRRGEVGRTILQSAREQHSDLILLGSPSAATRFNGSLTDFVARNFDQSILVVRGAPEG